jgi:N utilization substance protein B
MTDNKTNVWARRKARRALVQALYEWQLSENSLSDIKNEFHEGDALKRADKNFFDELLGLTIRGAQELDGLYEHLLDRKIEQLGHVERAVLRLATAEFSHRIDVPYVAVIDEYVELSKTFGAQDSYKYINGVLDKLAIDLRPIEVEAAKRG